jgi:transmembrane sensor
MQQRETASEIDTAAAEWAARIDRAPLSPQEDRDLDAWLEADIRHQGAYAKARAVMILSERARALGPNFDADKIKADMVSRQPAKLQRPHSRRQLLTAGSALAASLAAGAVGLSLWTRAPSYATKRGEIRLVPLSDGSSVTLNTASTARVRYGAARREVALVGGEALFDVAKNAERPFIVDAGLATVRAIGTSFTVRRLSETEVEILVREGIVEVLREGIGAATAGQDLVRLVANQMTTVRTGTAIVPVDLDPETVARRLAWREGMIAFEGMSLKEATEQFARYSDPRIVVDDPSVGAETITGLFSANNPTDFANYIALSLNLNRRSVGDEIHLSR